MKKILIYCLIYCFISVVFYIITIDFSKKDFMCENIKENSINTCNNIEYFFKETPLWALLNLTFYPFILFILIISIKKYRYNNK
jgi:hypothetical protein